MAPQPWHSGPQGTADKVSWRGSVPAGHDTHSRSPDPWRCGTVEGWQLQQAASVTAVLGPTGPGFGVAPGPQENVAQDGFQEGQTAGSWDFRGICMHLCSLQKTSENIVPNPAAGRRHIPPMPGIFGRSRGILQLLSRLLPESTCLVQGLQSRNSLESIYHRHMPNLCHHKGREDGRYIPMPDGFVE